MNSYIWRGTWGLLYDHFKDARPLNNKFAYTTVPDVHLKADGQVELYCGNNWDTLLLCNGAQSGR